MKKHRHLPLSSCLVLLLTALGCSREPAPLQWDDLTTGERLYCERVIALERAKSVALIHRETGAGLLDSLATAWGDSALPETLAGLPAAPQRTILVNDFLLQVMRAEQDSLRQDPGANRLHLPLPEPNRRDPAQVPADGEPGSESPAATAER